MSSVDLREKQKEMLLKMLSMNASSNSDGEQWKVFVYDRTCRDIISPILKLHELRKRGVTLHLMLDGRRDGVPDVPAVYFITPSAENVQIIANDCAKDLYQSAYINFASPVPRNVFEMFARSTVESNSANKVSKVFDQYLNFVTLEPQLFCLNHSNSYVAYNSSQVADEVIENTMASIVQGLFSVVATLGVIPIIRCPNNDGPSALVANKLNAMIREHLDGRTEVFSEAYGTVGFQRPVLIIMDRNEDLPSALHHPSTYQALVDDMLSINMNRVNVQTVSQKSGQESSVKKTYDLDVTSDSFFNTHAGDLFPDAIGANEEEMKQVTKREEELRERAGAVSSGGTQGLAAAVDTLPALIEKKKMLEIHTNIFQGTFEVVAQRHVPSYSMIEQNLIDGSHVDKNEILQLISDAEKGSMDDKMRLVLVYYLTTSASSVDMQTMRDALSSVAEAKGTSVDFSALEYLCNHPSFQNHASVGGSISASMENAAKSPSSAAASMSMFKGIAGNLAGQAQGWIQQAAASVKHFLPENKKLHVTRVTDAICEVRPNTEDDTFLYLDPKIKSTQAPRQQSPFRDAIVFMIGGGNYNEYHNLQAYAKASPSTQGRHILYGCTELFRPESFLRQLESINR